MKKHTRVLSLLMTLVLALGLFPMAAFAAGYPNVYDVSFQLKDGTVIAQNKVSYVSSVTVPEYRDVETWYCEALNMEVATGETVFPVDFDTDKNVVFCCRQSSPRVLHSELLSAQRLQGRLRRSEPQEFYEFLHCSHGGRRQRELGC